MWKDRVLRNEFEKRQRAWSSRGVIEIEAAGLPSRDPEMWRDTVIYASSVSARGLLDHESFSW